MADVTILDLPLRTVLDETDFLHIIDNTTNIDERTTILILANWILENSNSAKFKVDLTNTRVGVNNATPSYLIDATATSLNEPIMRLRHSTGNPAFTVSDDSGRDALVTIADAAGDNKILLHSDGDSYFQGGNVSIGSDTTPTKKLQINTASASDGISVIADNATQFPVVQTDSNRPVAGDILGRSLYKWNGGSVAAITAVAGSDTINKDNGKIIVQTSSSGSTPIDRLSVDENGLVNVTRDLGSELRFSNTSTAITSGNTIGNISFDSPNELSGGTGIGAEILASAEGDIGTEPLYALKIRTFNTGGSLQDRVTVSSTGDMSLTENILIPNDKAYRAEKADTTDLNLLKVNSSDEILIGGIDTQTNTVKIQENGADAIVLSNSGSGIQFPNYGEGPIVSDASGNLTAAGPSLSLIPSGAVVAWPTSTLPAGWLECDGGSVLRATYPELFAVIGTEYGFVSSLHFNIPDYRGQFLRGWDNGAGNDPDAASRTDRGDGTTGDNVGTKQLDAFQGHLHERNVGINEAASGSGKESANGSFNLPTGIPQTDTVSGVPRTSSETRPTNINVQYIIKT